MRVKAKVETVLNKMGQYMDSKGNFKKIDKFSEPITGK